MKWSVKTAAQIRTENAEAAHGATASTDPIPEPPTKTIICKYNGYCFHYQACKCGHEVL